MTFTTQELPEARAKIEFEIAPGEIDKRIEVAAEKLSNEVKMPGFRQGKVPSDLVLQKLGRDTVFQQAFEDSVIDWYAEALRDSDIAPIGSPKLAGQIDAPESGDPLKFDLEVAVRPIAKLRDYEGIEVGRGEAQYDAAVVDQELDAIRERFATLETVERAAQQGDFVQIDFTGRLGGEPFEGGAAKDFVLELGSERFIEGFEEQLVGVSAGDELNVEVTFPADYGNEELAGKPAVFEVKVHEVKEKRLNELDDTFAQENLGYDSIQELRDEIETRARAQAEETVDSAYRWAVVDAVGAKAEVEVPHDHIHSRAHELWHDMAQSLAQRGIDPRAYVQSMGKTEHEFIVDAEGDAEKTIRRESVIAAVIEQENIEVSEDDLIEAMTGGDDAQRPAAEEQLAKIREAGQEDRFLRDVAAKKAIDFLADKATPIAEDLAEARDALWTPDKGEQEAGQKSGAEGGGLWTPGS